MFSSTSRRFLRTNDYRMGERIPARVRAKEGIRMVRPAEGSVASTSLSARRDRKVRRDLASAA